MKSYLTNGEISWEIPEGRIADNYNKNIYIPPTGWAIKKEGDGKMKTLEVLEKVLKGKRIKQSTIKGYRLALQSLAEYSEEWPVSGVIFNEWLNSLQMAEATVYLYYQKIRAAGIYMEKAYKVQNATGEIEVPKVKKQQRRYFSNEELMTMIASCKYSYDRELILTLIDSGCRISELANLKGGEIKDGYFIAYDAKTGDRKYRLDIRICKALKELAGSPEQYVFKSGTSKWNKGNEHLTGGALSMRIRHIAERSGLSGKKLGAHTVRHSVGSIIAEETLSPLAVKAILQQDKVDTAMIYVHDVEEKLAKRMSPLQIIGEKNTRNNGGETETVIKQLMLAEKNEIKTNDDNVEKVEAVPDFISDMFVEIRENTEIRPLLRREDLEVMRKAFVLMGRDGRFDYETNQARLLMKRILRKSEVKING